MHRIAAFSHGLNTPSARFRLRQYIPVLLNEGFEITEFYSPFGSYPPQARWQRPAWGIAALTTLLPGVIRSHKFDAVLLQREMVSTMVTLEPFVKKPRILDVDDAIFLYRNGLTARRLAQMSDLIICGNSYLAGWFEQWNHNVQIIPTAVDTKRFAPSPQARDAIVLGWIGTSSNLKYLEGIETALAKVLKNNPRAKLRVVCDMPPQFRLIPPDRMEFLLWSEKQEAELIQGMDIGIMPLENTSWTQGKCSFKMLQYMACGLPVVVSPVGMNVEVLARGNCGIGAVAETDWTNAITGLITDEQARRQMGECGRAIVESEFSIHVLAPKIANCLRHLTCGQNS